MRDKEKKDFIKWNEKNRKQERNPSSKGFCFTKTKSQSTDKIKDGTNNFPLPQIYLTH